MRTRFDLQSQQCRSEDVLYDHVISCRGYGYTGSRYFLNSSVLKAGDENVLVVRVDCTNPDGWWCAPRIATAHPKQFLPARCSLLLGYPDDAAGHIALRVDRYDGGGIYRNVWFTYVMSPGPVIAPWGVYCGGSNVTVRNPAPRSRLSHRGRGDPRRRAGREHDSVGRAGQSHRGRRAHADHRAVEQRQVRAISSIIATFVCVVCTVWVRVRHSGVIVRARTRSATSDFALSLVVRDSAGKTVVTAQGSGRLAAGARPVAAWGSVRPCIMQRAHSSDRVSVGAPHQLASMHRVRYGDGVVARLGYADAES